MNIDWTKLRDKFGLKRAFEKFEELAFMYVKDIYPQYTWEKTPLKNDGNRDIQLQPKENAGYDIWAEAKYRNSSNKADINLRSLERKDLDSTILSGLIHGHVRMIIFISNAKLPNQVMDRAMLGARIRGIEVTAALSNQLSNWLIKNPDKYKEIFEEELLLDATEQIEYDVENVSIYDPISTDFNPLNKKKDFIIGEFAILNIIVFSSIDTTGAILHEDRLPFSFINKEGYETSNRFNVKQGLSNIVFFVRMKSKYHNIINMELEINGNVFFISTNQVSIKTNNYVKLAYSKQMEIIHKAKTVIRNTNPYENGLIISIYAESSLGKSFILRNIYNDLNLNFDMTLITFDSNKSNLINYTLLCKSVLFATFGNIFWDYDLSSKVSVDALKNEIIESYPNNLYSKDILMQLIDGCRDANIAANIIKSLIFKCKNDNILLVNSSRQKIPKILLMDDFQYLDNTQAEFIMLFIDQLKREKNSIIVIISSTKGKYYSQKLENYFLSLTPNHFVLEGLNATDKEQTIQNIYKLPIDKCSSARYFLPSSPLLASEVLKSISEEITDMVKDPLDIIMAYSKCVDEAQILRNKFIDYRKQFYLLDIIYRFKKGVPSSVLKTYFNRTSQYLFDIKLLNANNLIKIEKDLIMPYHDYYTNAYKRLRKSSFNNSKVGEFLKYVLELNLDEKSLDTNHILSMIIRCGEKYKKVYEKSIQKLILKYVHETQFGVAIYFCQYYYEQICLLNPQQLSHDQAYYLYLYVDCLVHCGKKGQAYRMLNEIYQTAPADSLPKYEAGASVLTQLFWRLKPDRIIPDSLYIQSGLESLNKQGLTNVDLLRVEKAYDSCFNRRMMAYFLVDDIKNAQKTYIDRMRMLSNANSNLNDFKSNAATLVMDYARGIIMYDASKGFSLMKLSLKYFNANHTMHYRRILICRIDCELMNNVCNNRYNADVFNECCAKLLDSQFYSEYFKAILKKCISYLIYYSINNQNARCFTPNCQIISDVENEIEKALLETELHPLDRDTLLLYYLKSFIAICRNDLSYAKELLEECFEITKDLGESYKFCIIHNLNNLSKITHISWYHKNKNSYSSTEYLVDCRFW